ncbi:Queuine/other tRNA-ribosyltransferase [Klebsormidium nitens]|uniref:Queuine tRNA-ribosyltransferase accessory subunit 2 n=1 Tax=Klebsormidium nitens TaxID=105231 RepID=A0A1Y1I0H5_KLENI|nr:Queuine/other tRNA-ribosyltransferase [Klebsormidium nitens]|eukprot:GAQ82287.1 Queuine/other tRNA-ribosyltransferase [Klebsormidium nitens]
MTPWRRLRSAALPSQTLTALKMLSFAIDANSGGARTGVLSFPSRGLTLPTPALLVYTRKGLPLNLMPDLLDELKDDGVTTLQLNTMHFIEGPSADTVRKAGGAHNFLGVQDYILLALGRDAMNFEGGGPASATYASFDTPSGRRQVTPEAYADIIDALRPDIFVPLADDIPSTSGRKRVKQSVDRSLSWLDECIERNKQGIPIFGSVQGGSNLYERPRSAEETAVRDVAGFHLGGFGLGESFDERPTLLAAAIDKLPPSKPRHVSGLSVPEEILQGVAAGVDLFDSAYPLSLTLAGLAMTFPVSHESPEVGSADGIGSSGATEGEGPALGADCSKLNLLSLALREDPRPLLPGCQCYTCRNHTRAYLHHLLNAHEMLAQVLLEIHNTHHYTRFFRAIRQSIIEDRFDRFRQAFVDRCRTTQIDVKPMAPKPSGRTSRIDGVHELEKC